MAIIWLFLLDDLPKSEIVLDYFISPQGGISHMACWKIHQPSFDDFPRYKCPFLGELDLWDIIYICYIYIYIYHLYLCYIYMCVYYVLWFIGTHLEVDLWDSMVHVYWS